MIEKNEIKNSLVEIVKTSILLGAWAQESENGVMFCFPARFSSKNNLSETERQAIVERGGFSIDEKMTSGEIVTIHKNLATRVACFISRNFPGVSSDLFNKGNFNRSKSTTVVKGIVNIDLYKTMEYFVGMLQKESSHREMIMQSFNSLELAQRNRNSAVLKKACEDLLDAVLVYGK